MSTGTTKAPNLPIAPVDYNQQYQDQLNNVLRLYFNQLDNPGPCSASTQRNGTKVIAALNFSQANATGVQVVSIPTQTDLVYLRVGDIYMDTANAYVLKVKI